jgi:hypothetical protein
MIDQKLCNEALQRIARTSDGRLLYLLFQKVVTGVPTDSRSGALKVNLGRRTLASELMAVMAETMTEATSDGTGDPSERPIIFSLARPVVVARNAGARRRVSADTSNADTDDAS